MSKKKKTHSITSQYSDGFSVFEHSASKLPNFKIKDITCHSSSYEYMMGEYLMEYLQDNETR